MEFRPATPVLAPRKRSAHGKRYIHFFGTSMIAIPRYSLTFLFVLTLVAGVATSIVRLPLDPSVEVIRVTIVLLLVLYFLKWSLHEHERLGARIRAVIAALTLAAFMVLLVGG